MNENTTSRLLIAGLMIALFAVSGCATKKPGEPMQVSAAPSHTDTATSADEEQPAAENNDPAEPVNRPIFRFTEIVDGVLISPLAHIYKGLMPDFAQTGVHNALYNINTPVVALNSLLQWDMRNLGVTLERFGINSTVGVAGLFDVATKWGIPQRHNKDFGQTLGVWGVAKGPFVEIPVLGPSDVRDTVGFVVDIASDPLSWFLNTDAAIAYETTRALVKRVDLFPLTDRVYRDSLDPYATFRSIYLQHRDRVVRDYRGADSGLETEK